MVNRKGFEEIFFHEDFYCQMEILPIENLTHCKKELDLIEENTQVDSDFGFSSIYQREIEEKSLKDLNITIFDIENRFKQSFSPYKKVYTGFSSYKEKAINTLAYGDRAKNVIFIQHNEKNIITNMWLNRAFKEILNLPNAEDLIFVDWEFGAILPLIEQESFETYLKDLKEY